MPELVNPLAAFRDAYGTLEGMAQDRTRRFAGNALAQGDYQGAQGALYGRGMLEEGSGVQRMQMGMEDRQRGQQAAQAEGDKEAAVERLGVLSRATAALRRLPPDQRPQMLQSQILPLLRQMPGFDEELLGMVAGSDLSDETLDGFAAALGQEEQKLQVVPRGGGGYDVLDMGTGDPVRSVEPQEQGEWKAEGGHMWFYPPDGSEPRMGPALTPAPKTFAPRGGGGGGRAAPKPPAGFIPDP